MSEDTIKSLKPPRHVWNDWRGGQIRSIGATATIRMHAEANVVRDYTGISLALVTGLTVGDPVRCRVSGGYPYSIAEVVFSRAVPSAPSDQAASVARGEYHPGIIEYSFTNEDDFWWRESPPTTSWTRREF